MRLSAVLLLGTLFGASAYAQPASRLFLSPTARPVASSVEAGTRFIVPSLEIGLGRRVSAGVTGLVLPRDGGGVNAGGAVDVRVALLNRERGALAVGVTGTGTYSGGDADPSVPASAHAYAVGTLGGERASASLGLGVRAQGANEYDLPTWACPTCLSIAPGEPTYRVRVRANPVVFGGAEAEIGREGAFGYRVVAEGLALPVAGGRYTTVVGGGLRVTHRRSRLDLGAMVGSEAWGGSERTTQVAPWVGFTTGI
jgi:hypothetical protein